jgi:hypothetical protein
MTSEAIALITPQESRMPVVLRALSRTSIFLSVFFAVVWMVLGYVHFANSSPLTLLYLNLAKEKSLVTCVVLLTAAVIFWLGARFDGWRQIVIWYCDLTSRKRTAVVFVISFVFVFILNSQSILHGFFHGDDFEYLADNRTRTLRQLVFSFGGDHYLPLFRLEVAALWRLFGANALAWNLFDYTIVALIACFSYLFMKRVGFSEKSFFLFFVLYAGSVKWGEMLAGYHSLSPYVQSSLFAVVALWSYTKWRATTRRQFLLLLALAILAGVLIDISGAWIIPTILLCMAAYSRQLGDTFSTFFRNNRGALLSLVIAVGLFGLYLLYVYLILHNPTITPRKDIASFGRDIYFVFSNGLVSSLLAPNASLFVSQPSLARVEKVWTGVLLIFCIAQIFLWIAALRKADRTTRSWLLAFLATLAVTLLIVATGRPGIAATHLRPEVHYTCAAYFCYCLSLTVVFEWWQKRSPKGRFVRDMIWVVLLGFFSVQLFSSFVSTKVVLDAQNRRAQFEEIQTKLAPILNEFKARPTVIADFPNAANSPRSLGNYLKLLPQLDHIRVVDIDSLMEISVGNSLSPEFVESLKSNEILRAYYFQPIEVHQDREAEAEKRYEQSTLALKDGVYNVRMPHQSKAIVLEFIATDHAPFTVDMYADNDFDVKGPLAIFHLDQNQPETPLVSLSLDKVYALSLSREMPAEIRFRINNSRAQLVAAYTY